MDHGPGLLEPFLCQIWTLLKGVGRVEGGEPQGAGSSARIADIG